MTRNITLLSGLAGLVLLVALAFYHGTDKIAQDLTLRGEATLTVNSWGWASLEVAGRNLHLSGEAPSVKQADLALQRLRELDGVNRVVDELTIRTDSETESPKPTSDAPWSSRIRER
jgi:osmotically-inducible protein OsmY